MNFITYLLVFVLIMYNICNLFRYLDRNNNIIWNLCDTASKIWQLRIKAIHRTKGTKSVTHVTVRSDIMATLRYLSNMSLLKNTKSFSVLKKRR